MWSQFRSLFFSPSHADYPDDGPPLDADDAPGADIDAGGYPQFAHLPPPRRYHYIPASIHAEASDHRPWRRDPDGTQWCRVPCDDADGDRDDDDEIAAQLAELDELDSQIAATKAAFYEELDRRIAERDSQNLSYDPSANFTPHHEWEPGDDA